MLLPERLSVRAGSHRATRTLVCALLAFGAERAHAAILAYVPNASDDTVSVIDTRINRVIKTIGVGRAPGDVDTSPDGTRVYIANGLAFTISVIDTTTNTVVQTIPLPGLRGDGGSEPEGPWDIAVDPTGARLYAAADIEVFVIDTSSGTVLTSLSGSFPNYYEAADGLALHSGGNVLFVADRANLVDDESGAAALHKTDLRTLMPSGRPGHSSADTISRSLSTGVPDEMAIDAEGRRLYIAHDTTPDGVVTMIDIATNGIEAIVPVGALLGGIAVHPDSSRVYVSNSRGHEVAVIDADAHQVVDRIRVGLVPLGLSLTPDGSRLYVANSSSHSVSAIDTATHAVVATVPVGDSPSASGRFIAATPGDVSPSDTVANALSALMTAVADAPETDLGGAKFKRRLTRVVTRLRAKVSAAEAGGRRAARRARQAQRLLGSFLRVVARGVARRKIDPAVAAGLSATAEAVKAPLDELRQRLGA
jgi:YVTN family beta-propeller protein